MLAVFNDSLRRTIQTNATMRDIALELLKMYLSGQVAKKSDGGIMAKILNGV
jgi:hypothetical protein